MLPRELVEAPSVKKPAWKWSSTCYKWTCFRRVIHLQESLQPQPFFDSMENYTKPKLQEKPQSSHKEGDGGWAVSKKIKSNKLGISWDRSAAKENMFSPAKQESLDKLYSSRHKLDGNGQK